MQVFFNARTRRLTVKHPLPVIDLFQVLCCDIEGCEHSFSYINL